MSTQTVTLDQSLADRLPPGYAEPVMSMVSNGEVAEATFDAYVTGVIKVALIPTRRCLMFLSHDDRLIHYDLRFISWSTITQVRAYKDSVQLDTAQGRVTSLHFDDNAAAIGFAARVAAYLPV